MIVNDIAIDMSIKGTFGAKDHVNSIAAKCLRTISCLFSPNQIDQSLCRVLTTHAKTRTILLDDWSIRLGENRTDRVLKHLAATLV